MPRATPAVPAPRPRAIVAAMSLLAGAAGTLRRVRAPGGLLVLLSLLVVLLLASVSTSALGGAPATTTAPGQGTASAPVPAPAPAGAPRYRIVGCRSRGTKAYLHGPHVREVAIGFDDGPAADTGAFVTMLERARVSATFFMIGEQVGPAYRNVLLRELRNGDVLGDHTFTHPDLVTAGGARSQLQRTLGVIGSLSGYTPCVFRPPYGAYDANVV